jgi:hypothetical protein
MGLGVVRNLICSVSDRDGLSCIWAQRLDAATSRPVGPPFPVFPAHKCSNLAGKPRTSLSVRAAMRCCSTWLTAVGPKGAHLVCRRKRDRRFVEAGWTISCLEDALRWMIWYDEFSKHPLVCCSECRTVFRRETAHSKKYCTHDCAHRATARVWQRKKRAEQHARRK